MLENLLCSLGQLSEDQAAHLVRSWHHPRSLKRSDYLSTPESADRFLYFVESGVLRIFCVSPEGEDVSVGFSYDGTFIGSYPSLVLGQPADFFIQAIGPCQLKGILWEDFERHCAQNHAIERCRRILAENALLGRLERETEMLTLSPDERYLRFFKRSGHLFQRIPQKYIASYLGVKPETLSRIRRRVDLRKS